MTNADVLFHIFQEGFATVHTLHSQLGLTSNDANARLCRFFRYKWLKRAKKVYREGGEFGHTGKAWYLVKKGVSYLWQREDHRKEVGGRSLFIYLISEKGKQYLRFRGYNV